MTKALLCVTCVDILAPYRDWQTDRRWRWCQCDDAAVRWLDGARGLLEVTSRLGPDRVRVIGLNNLFLEHAVTAPARVGGLLAGDWRELHETCATAVDQHYLFHRDNRACWALVVQIGEAGDITWVPYPVARYGPPPDGEEG